MKPFGIKIFLLLLPALLIPACSRLQVKYFRGPDRSTNPAVVTSSGNFQRNYIARENITPPLKVVWEDDYTSIAMGGFTFSDSVLFLGSGNGYTIAINSETGKELGKKQIGKACPAPPSISGIYLYQTYNNGRVGLVAYDVRNGDELWESEYGPAAGSAVVTDERVIYQTLRGEMLALNRVNGIEIWKNNLGHSPLCSPAFASHTIITAGINGKIVALDASSGVVIWQTQTNLPVFADPVIYEDRVYLAGHDGQLLVLRLKDGRELQRRHLKVPVYNGVSVDPGGVYIGLSDGRIMALSSSTLKTKWEKHPGGPLAAPILVSPDFLYAASLDQHFYVIDKITGEILQNIETDGRFRSAPTFYQGKLYIAAENKRIVVYGSQN
jgi:outer membrane protein assembly factor BamB